MSCSPYQKFLFCKDYTPGITPLPEFLILVAYNSYASEIGWQMRQFCMRHNRHPILILFR